MSSSSLSAAAAEVSKGSPGTPKSSSSPSKKSQQRRYSGGPNNTLSEHVSKYLNNGLISRPKLAGFLRENCVQKWLANMSALC